VTTAGSRGAPARAWRAGLNVARYRPRRYLLGGSLWSTLHVVPVLTGLVLKALFDRLTVDGDDVALAGALGLVALYVATVAGRSLVWWSAMVAWPAWWHSVLAYMRGNVLRSLLCDREPPVTRLPGTPGEAVARFRDDAEDVVWFVDIWVDVAGGVVFTGIALWVMLAIDPVVTLMVVLPMVAVVIGTRVLSQRLRRSHADSRSSGASVTSLVGELVGGALALKVAGAERAAMARLRQANAARGDHAVRAEVFLGLIEVCSMTAIEVSIGLVLLLSAPDMRTGEFTVGDLALFTAYAGWLTGLPRWMGRMLARQRHATVALGRLGRMLPGADSEAVVAHSPAYLRTPPPPAPTPAAGDDDRLAVLAVEGLTAHHPSSGRGIDGVSLEVARGELAVVTGAVGSGKTTLLRTLLGLFPGEAGTVRWNGTVVEDPGSVLVPPRCAYVAQAPRLLSASLAENLALGWPATETDIAAALRLATLEGDVDELPDGTATLVGPRGTRLSGGQLLRAAAARALVRRPELLVLDDLSSALDVETEERLWSRIAAADVTCLVVSHRLAALRRAHRVIVLDHGQVVGDGPLDAVLRDCAEMRRLWREESLVEAEEVV